MTQEDIVAENDALKAKVALHEYALVADKDERSKLMNELEVAIEGLAAMKDERDKLAGENVALKSDATKFEEKLAARLAQHGIAKEGVAEPSAPPASATSWDSLKACLTTHNPAERTRLYREWANRK